MSLRVKYTVINFCSQIKKVVRVGSRNRRQKRLEDTDAENMQDFGVGVKATHRI